MRGLFCLLFLLSPGAVWGCPQPTAKELSLFFEGAPFWTEVRDAASSWIAEKRPVFLHVPFEHPKRTRIRWGDNLISGDSLSLCWARPEKDQIIIQKGFFRTRLVKVKPGLLKSWIPIDGDLFYRKDQEVQRSSELRTPAKQDKTVDLQESSPAQGE